MQATTEYRRDLVLVGGGHAHALVLRMWAMSPVAGVRLTLISPASFTPYSGMLPGLVAGHYSFEETHIDLARLCQWAGVRFLRDEVLGLDPERRELTLAGRPPLAYDLLSIDIGSQPELDSVPGAREHATPVKPVAGLWQRWQAFEAGAEGQHIAVVGGGAGSVELVLAMANRLSGRGCTFTLYCGADDILQGYNAGARRAVHAALEAAGVTLVAGQRVATVTADALQLETGEQAAYDQLFWCTGAAPAGWIAASGLAVDDSGFMAVSDTLQSSSDPRIFGAGDIATQVNNPRPKAGVYAVRQAPVLAHNLAAALLDTPLKTHRPQQRFLSLLSLGAKRATADRGWFAATGEWVWHWKDRIDREFMDRFAGLEPMREAPTARRLPGLDGLPAPCGGCGAKLGADLLGEVLAELAGRYPDACRASEPGDDAVALAATAGGSLLQSVDLLRQLVDDPFVMGRIAANHALSDLYACGAEPRSALALITLPFADAPLQRRELGQVLAGALNEFQAVGCVLTGGHSMQGAEFSVGFVVNGELPPGRQALAKQGLAAGDALVLCKALGTGTLMAAQMQLRADGRDIEAALAMMLQSNGAAAEAAVENGASAATDVTGFGLAVHLAEMLGEQQAAQLTLEQLPALPGALGALAAGIVSSNHEANLRSAPGISANDSARLGLLFDPQTSGGLLLGIAPERLDDLLAALATAGYVDAAVIGQVIERAPGAAQLEIG